MPSENSKCGGASNSAAQDMVPTDEEFRALGFTGAARAFPRDELAVVMLAAFNNYPLAMLPPAAKFFPNEATAQAWGRVADAARTFIEKERGDQ